MTAQGGAGGYEYEIFGIGAAGNLSVEAGEATLDKWGIFATLKYSARRSSADITLLEIREP